MSLLSVFTVPRTRSARRRRGRKGEEGEAPLIELVEPHLPYTCHTMDSKGRKIVVCDNGTGVSIFRSPWEGKKPFKGNGSGRRLESAVGAGEKGLIVSLEPYISYTRLVMDSNGRKVVVCDNGTGVSALPGPGEKERDNREWLGEVASRQGVWA